VHDSREKGRGSKKLINKTCHDGGAHRRERRACVGWRGLRRGSEELETNWGWKNRANMEKGLARVEGCAREKGRKRVGGRKEIQGVMRNWN
jgi:hypothetical protein